MDLALICPVWPFDARDGHRLAVLSDIHAILDNKLQLGVIAFTYGDEEAAAPLCETRIIPALGGGFVTRFFRGLVTDLPPSAERLYGERAKRELRNTLLAWKPKAVLIDDASVAGYIPHIRELLPSCKVILRSHNVMHDVRLEQLRRTRGITKPAIKFDCDRYIAFERGAVDMCDRLWAISHADAQRLTHLYRRSAECLTVSLPLEKYETLRLDQGSSNGFVHVGTLDFRRRTDLGQFLSTSWPRVLHADPGSRLTLAGALHGQAIPAPNVTYAGRVNSDAEIYSLGRFALNFQSTTGGIKLKTLTSMAAGRTLVSTQAGVEGISIESGRHYLDIDSFVSNADLKQVLRDVQAALPIADAGRQYVRDHHSRTAVADQFRHLFEAV